MTRFSTFVLVIALCVGAGTGCLDAKKAEQEALAKAKAQQLAKEKTAAAAKAKADADAKAKAEAEAAKKVVVFDPRNPPPGYVNCHRNHCHKEGGGVASYAAVMEAIGATKIVGMPKSGPVPKAPADVAAPPADAVKTASGLATKVMNKGSGTEKPSADSIVTVHYTGWTADGKGFQSTATSGEPAKVPLARVFPGWREGMQMMVVGEERRMWIPENIAFQGRPGAPAGMIVFDVELLSIQAPR